MSPAMLVQLASQLRQQAAGASQTAMVGGLMTVVFPRPNKDCRGSGASAASTTPSALLQQQQYVLGTFMHATTATHTSCAGLLSYVPAVPVCDPGEELDLDLLVCVPCSTGNSISPGGRVSQGTAQPRCGECPWGTAANATRTVCVAGETQRHKRFARPKQCRTTVQ